MPSKNKLNNLIIEFIFYLYLNYVYYDSIKHSIRSLCITHQNIRIHLCLSDVITISTDTNTKVYVRLDKNEWQDNITSYSNEELYSIIRSILLEVQKSKSEVKLIYTKAA